jgi:hypothetical protein
MIFEQQNIFHVHCTDVGIAARMKHEKAHSAWLAFSRKMTRTRDPERTRPRRFITWCEFSPIKKSIPATEISTPLLFQILQPACCYNTVIFMNTQYYPTQNTLIAAIP